MSDVWKGFTIFIGALVFLAGAFVGIIATIWVFYTHPVPSGILVLAAFLAYCGLMFLDSDYMRP